MLDDESYGGTGDKINGRNTHQMNITFGGGDPDGGSIFIKGNF